MKRTMNEAMIRKYQTYLIENERSKATIEKYIRDIYKFYNFLDTDKTIHKEVLIAYKESLLYDYKPTSINSMLVAINNFLDFLSLPKCKVKLIRLQKRVFCNKERELTKKEYLRILQVAKEHQDDRLYILIQTLCATGIRVSEHKAITYEAINEGVAKINNKGKLREIYFDTKLRKILLNYCQRQHITSGCIFITKSGKPLDRSNIWKMMKKLCEDAHVKSEKVFPHNLRHLFAFTYYRVEKDLVSLAGMLGHSSIETTRIYTMSKGEDCCKSMKRMNLLPNP